MRRFISSLLALSCITAYPVLANDEDNWWFDIEVMVFSRDASLNDLPELFERQQDLSARQTDWDLLTNYYQPDITMIYNSLPVCGAPDSPIWYEKPSREDILRDYYIAPEPVEEPQTMALTTVADEEPELNDPFTEEPQTQLQDEAQANESLSNIIDETSVVDAEPELIPPSESAIAGYWLSSVLSEQQLTPFRIQRRPLDCVASRLPELDTTGDNWHWTQPDLYIPPREQTPLLIHGADFARANGPHLLSTKHLSQDDIYTSIRWRKGLKRLAHFSWRQQVKFGQDKAETLRLFAGQNFAKQFTQNGDLRPQEIITSGSQANLQDVAPGEQTDTFFSELNRRLTNPQPISFAGMTAPAETNDDGTEQSEVVRLAPIWELDGFIQIYLKYINRVPYLHVNSELFYRQPVLSTTTMPGTPPVYELVSVPFSQQRRVISTQLHYFDHPLFGMLVQIRRYDRPAAPAPDEETD